MHEQWVPYGIYGYGGEHTAGEVNTQNGDIDC